MALPNSLEILQAVIDATPDAIFVKDLDGRYVIVNEAAASFLGKSPDEVVGRNDLELYPEKTARQFMADDRGSSARSGPAASTGSGCEPFCVTDRTCRAINYCGRVG